MRNSHNITLTNNDSLTEDEETTCLSRVVAVSPTEDVESSSDAWDEDAVFQGAGWVN